MRLTSLVACGVLGCGGGGSGGPKDAGRSDVLVLPDAPMIDAPMIDAPMSPIDAATGTNTGFTAPTAPIAAWTETAQNTFAAATLDFSCLNAARGDTASTVAITLAATIVDFQSGNIVPGTVVEAFAGNATGAPFATATANGSAVATLAIPTGTTRFGFHMTETNTRPTYIFDQLLAPSTAAQSRTMQVLSNATAQTLPALIGVSSGANATIEIGTATDCQGHTLSGLIATISSVAGTATHLPAAQTYYFSDSVGLPVRHTQAAMTTKDGNFMVIELPATATAYVQMWGYRTAGELAAGTLTLISQLAVPVPGAAAMMTRHDPRATQ
jgi:hypothetical protein